MSVECLWDECVSVCVFASEHKAAPAGENGTHEAGKRAWDPCRGTRWTEGSMPVLRGSANVHVLLNLESVVCVLSLVNFCLCHLKRRKGTWLSMLMFYVGPICMCC